MKDLTGYWIELTNDAKVNILVTSCFLLLTTVYLVINYSEIGWFLTGLGLGLILLLGVVQWLYIDYIITTTRHVSLDNFFSTSEPEHLALAEQYFKCKPEAMLVFPTNEASSVLMLLNLCKHSSMETDESRGLVVVAYKQLPTLKEIKAIRSFIDSFIDSFIGISNDNPLR